MFQFTQNESTASRRRIFFYAVSSTDGYTAVTTGLSTSTVVLIVKNGVTPGTSPVSPTFTHISNGLWYYEMTAAHLDTVGVLTVTITDSLIRAVQLIGYVYSGDPLTALPSFPANFSSLAITVGGAVTVGTINNNVITASSIASDAIQASKFQDSALVIGSGAGTGVKAYLAANAIAAGNIAADALQASKFQDSALVVGNAAGTGVKAYLAANAVNATVLANDAITAAKIATGAIDADAIATGAIDADAIAADAITAAKIASGAIDADAIATGAIDADAIAADAITSAKIADSAITIRLSTDATASEGRLLAGVVAGDVWNATAASYTTAGTFGKLMDTLKKANFVIEGTTTAGSTTTSVNTNLTGYVLNAFEHQTVLFISGTLAGSCGLVSASSTGGGVLTTDEPLPGAPAAGVDFVILGTHVHTKSSIADTTWSTDISGYASPTAGYACYEGLIQAGLSKAFAESMTLPAYQQDMADYLLGRNIAGGSSAGRTVSQALFALRNKSEIVGSTLNVYDEVDGSISWTATVATSATADPVTGIDPA